VHHEVAGVLRDIEALQKKAGWSAAQIGQVVG
jgi:hypothetical protein